MTMPKRDLEDASIKIPAPEFGSWTAVATHAAKVSNPAARFGHGFGQLADKAYMTPAHCVMYLARRVGEARQARDRASWFGGRVYNWLTGTKFETVDMSGAVFANSLKCLGEPVPDDFPRGADFTFPFEVAERLESDLR